MFIKRCLSPLLAVLSIFAASFSAQVHAFSNTSAGNVTTYAGFTATSSNIGAYTLSTASDGTVLIKSGARMATPGGGSIPIDVTGGVPRANVAGALGRFALRVGSSLTVALGVGVALYDLGKELGFTLDNSSGTLLISQPGLGTDMWRVNTSSGAEFQCRVASMEAACGCAGLSWGGIPNYCMPGYRVPVKVVGTSQPGVSEPRTIQQLEDAIASKSGWPTSSALATALKDAIKAGESVSVGTPTVTGPATSPGPATQTVNVTNNTTTTSTTTHTHTYTGPQVGTQTTTTVVTRDSTTGAELDRKVITETPVVPASPSGSESEPFAMPCGIAGTPPCAVKADESGTPPEVAENIYAPKLADPKAKQAELLEKAAGDSDKSMFSGWAQYFITPPIAACQPFVLPRELGTIDPCPVAGGIRSVVGYLFALTGLAGCLSMVREVI